MSNNLNLPEVAENQTHKEVTVNTAFAAVDAALTELLTVDLTADVHLTAGQWRTAMKINVMTSGTSKVLYVPQVKKLSVVENLSANSIGLACGAGVAVPLAAGASAILYQDGTANALDVYAVGTIGLPSGGTLRQVLGKKSGTTYDVDWIDQYAPLIFGNHTDNYTFVLADRGKMLEFDKASALSATVPANTSVAFDVGDWIELVQIGAGQLTLVPDTGVSILSAGDKTKLSGQYSMATLVKRSANVWYLAGDLTS